MSQKRGLFLKMANANHVTPVQEDEVCVSTEN